MGELLNTDVIAHHADEINQVKNDADVDDEEITGHGEGENDSSGFIEEVIFLLWG